MHLEYILSYGILVALYWFTLGNPIENALVQPNQGSDLFQMLKTFSDWIGRDEQLWLYHLFNAVYALVLCFWGPIYVASGFTLYLNARTLSEAWDIRLVFRRLAERLQQNLPVWAAIGLALCMAFQAAPVQAETLPDEAKVNQSRRNSIEQKPFPYLKADHRYCWRTCAEKAAPLPDNSPTTAPALPSLKFLAYGLAALLLLGVLYGIWRVWRSRGFGHADALPETPTTLFGLNLTPETLPEHVSATARQLFATDPRAALSLLYRATLSKLIHQHHLRIRSSDTEGQVLALAEQQAAQLHSFVQPLTQTWVAAAYGHQLPDSDTAHNLCQQYALHFEGAAAAVSGSLNGGGHD